MDPVMTKVRSMYKSSGLTLDTLGVLMGYEKNQRQSAWQFMKSNDPQISTLRRFAKALGLTIEELIHA